MEQYNQILGTIPPSIGELKFSFLNVLVKNRVVDKAQINFLWNINFYHNFL